ncbi:MAG: 3-oxoacyl-[acyl-carrier protein] reductase [Planctomycetota bacterium]|jgi:3-oxoacyl-[acyl-carrier protein] reductase
MSTDSASSPRRALVTGSSRGIGRAIAVELAEAGFAVTINYRSNRGLAEELAKDLRARGLSAQTLGFDVADRDSVRQALEEDVASHGAYWCVVHNAGVTADGPMAGMAGDAWDRVLRTNLDGFYNVVQPLLMPMVRLRDGGRVVAISSVSGISGNRGQSNYAASKAGLVGAAKSLAQEMGKRKITVNCVAPGFIETDMVAEVPLEQVVAHIPLKRAGQAEEVAGLVAYLVSDRAAYVTGQCWAIDGGMT